METGRELFTRFLNRESLSRPPFVPLVRGLAARVGGIPAQTMHSDPTLWANLLLKTAELFDFDGVVAGLDFTLLAEACGCEISWRNDHPVILHPSTGLCPNPEAKGRMKNALEKADRVFQVCRSRRACVAALTGPVTLASQLFGREEGHSHFDEVKQLVCKVTEAFCRTRPDVMIFMEGRPLGEIEPGPTHRRLYNTLKNITSYYNIPVGLYLQGYRPERVERFAQLRMDLYVLGPSLDNGMAPRSHLWNLDRDALGLGIGLPLDDLATARKIITEEMEFYRAKGGKGFFFTSFGPATRNVDLEELHQLVKEIATLHL